MVSSVVTTIPVDGIPSVKSEFRTNWTTIKNEIEGLQAQAIDLEALRDGQADDPTGNTALFNAGFDKALALGGGTISLSRHYEINGAATIHNKTTLLGNNFEVYVTGASTNVLLVGGNGVRIIGIRGRAGPAATGWLGSTIAFSDLQVLFSEFYGDGGAVGVGSITNAPYAMLRFSDREIRRVLIMGNYAHHGSNLFHFNDSNADGDIFADIDIVNNIYDNVNSAGGINAPAASGFRIRFVGNHGSTFIKPGGTVFAIADFAGCIGLQILDNNFNSFVGRGFWLEDDCEDFVIANNVIRNGIASDSATVGVSFGDGNKDTITVANDCKRGLIQGNCIKTVIVSTAAIDVHAAGQAPNVDIDVLNNRIDGVTRGGVIDVYGIRVDGTTGNLPARVIGNRISNVTGGDGISASPNCEINDNICVDVSGRGFRYYTTGSRQKRINSCGNRTDFDFTSTSSHSNTDGTVRSVREENPHTRRRNVDTVEAPPATWTCPWVTLFDLGVAAKGTLSVMAYASSPVAQSLLEVGVSWNGTTLTEDTPRLLNTTGQGTIELRASSGNLQVKIADADVTGAKEFEFDAVLHGWITF